LLWERYGRAAAGFPDDAVQALCEEATGVKLQAFFDAYVRGREEVDLERFLGAAGLRIEEQVGTDPTERGGGWLGIQTRELPGSRTQIVVVLDGGPAARGGLYAGDELVALDGFRVDER